MNKSYCVTDPGGYVFRGTEASTKILSKRIFLVMSKGQHTDEEVESRWRHSVRDGFRIGDAPGLFQ